MTYLTMPSTANQSTGYRSERTTVLASALKRGYFHLPVLDMGLNCVGRCQRHVTHTDLWQTLPERQYPPKAISGGIVHRVRSSL